MSKELLPEFEEYWGARGWKMDRIVHPSGYIEFCNADTHHIWMGWKQARLSASTLASADWRPIETAPKDGTRFLAAYGDAGSVTTMILHWINAYDAFCDDEGIPHTAFTHYQPLPPPPSE